MSWSIQQMMEEQRLRLLADAATDCAVFMLDPEGIIVSWTGADELKSRPADDIVGHPYAELFCEEDRRRRVPDQALASARKEGRYESEGWRLRPDGNRFWAFTALETIKDENGSVVGLAQITRDISERYAAQAALRDSERQFRMLVSGVTDHALYMLDRDGIIITWNSGAENITGYKAEEITGQHFSRFYTEMECTADVPSQALIAAARHGKFKDEGWRVRKDGRLFFASEVIDAMRDEEGFLIGFAKVTRDITERRQAQQALERSQEQLAYLKKMEALGHLTGSIAHNFNNLLMIVTGHAQTVKKRLEDDPKGLRAVEAIETAAKRGAALTRHMLSFSGRRQLNPETLDLKKLVEAFGWLLTSLVVDTQLLITIPDDIWSVESDASELELALVNIVLNSREAMPEGGTITITAENARFSGTHGLSGDFVTLKVTDTGVGIPSYIIHRVFDPFFTTKANGKGAGLGLSQVYGFAVQSRGAATAQSEVGKGTEIAIHLPRVNAASPVASNERVVESRGAARVLIVEDNPEVAEVTASLMDQLGHEYLVADSAEMALALLERGEKFDLVFTDILMPGPMDGLALAHALRHHYRRLPILLASGLAKPVDRGEEEFPLLRKPYEIGDLRRAISNLLDRPKEGEQGNLLRFADAQRSRKGMRTDQL